MQEHQTRREFLRETSKKAVALGAASYTFSSITESQTASEKAGKISNIFLIHNNRAINNSNKCNQEEAKKMIDMGLFSMSLKNDTKEAWTSLGVTKSDVIAIKVNCNSASFPLYAHPELVYALCESLATVVPKNNIIIYERSSGELSRAGFEVNKSSTGVQCFGNEEGDGFDRNEELTRIITDRCTKLINFPSLKLFGGDFAGTLFLKNHVGSLQRSHMPKCHGNTPFLSEISSRPSIKNKTFLAVCDGLRATYERSTPWYWGGIIMSKDPIAAEYAALSVINEKRKQEKISEIDIPGYVKLADTKYNLGTSDKSKMNLVTLKIE
jgi:hypothetical protein